MNYFRFIFKSALEDFKRNKIRTVLTSLGILIGVASVVLLIAFGLGLKAYIKNQFESLGTNLIMAMPGKILSSSGGFSTSGGIGGINFDEKDVTAIKKIKNTLYVVPEFIKTVTVASTGKSEIGTLDGTTADIFPMSNLELETGMYFEKGDVDKKSKNVVIGPKLAQKIFGSTDNALGKIVKIQKQAFRIIGILKSKGGGGLGGPDLDSYVYVPYKSASAFNVDKTFQSISVKAVDAEAIVQIKEEMKTALLKNYKEDEFSIVEMTEILNAVSSIFALINSILIAIGAISLLVGGIGIMNIMYVSVMERIREIGIRRALGARGRDILVQFLSEAVLLSLLGGFLGLALSFLVVAVIRNFFPAYIDVSSVLIALGVCCAIGILFGVFPAKKASDLSPIEAIRYE